MYFINFNENRALKRLKRKWKQSKNLYMTLLLTISYITMGTVVYWATPVNSILSVIVLCSLTNFISAVFFIKGMRYQMKIEEAVENKIKDRWKRARIRRAGTREKRDKKNKKRTMSKKKRIDTKKNTNRV
jgi:hypothetical protein